VATSCRQTSTSSGWRKPRVAFGPVEGRVIDDAALRSDELRAISAWLKERARIKPIGKAFFVSEQRKQLHRSTVNLLMRTYSKAASLPLLTHPHMLRHACGFALADQSADTRLIEDYLGHRNIQHTVKCTPTNPVPFEKLWR
jgi:type 1 fimbriae regulatory protein FimB